VHPIAWIFAHKARNLPNPIRRKLRVVFADLSHWTGLGARGGHEEDVGLLLEARACPEKDLIATNCRPSRLPVGRLLWPISAAVSEQIGYLPSSRSRRSSGFRQWCPIVRDRATQAASNGGFPTSFVSSGMEEGKALSVVRSEMDDRN
jgi:hypothetical protein